MLRTLRIKNFAIIRDQEIEFRAGLNVISGETGSGKSLIMNALEFVLGSKLGSGFVRAGEKLLEVEALFDITGLPEEIRSQLPDFLDEDDFVITRTAGLSGRGKIYLNGRLATVSLLQQVSRALITICSQAEHVQLLDARAHGRLLDDFAGSGEKLLHYRELYQRWQEVSRRYERMRKNVADAEIRREEVEEELAAFQEVDVTAELRKELEQTITTLKNGEQLQEASDELLSLLLHERGVLALLRKVSQHAHTLVQLDSSLSWLVEAQCQAEQAVEACEQGIQHYLAGLELDEQQLERARTRLSGLARLERKYRVDGAELVVEQERLEQVLREIPTPDRLQAVEKEQAALSKTLLKAASAVRIVREKAARKLETAIATELCELSMTGARVAVRFEETEPTLNGIEQIEFMLQANPGEPAKPLRKVASGGELSRLTLVLKKLLRDTARVNVLVFDEVDTGISGGVARAVGAKLRALAENSQVICVSHLPQVASLAAHNLLVEKSGKRRVESKIKCLEGEERVHEIARMLAGFEVTEAAKESARELLSSNS